MVAREENIWNTLTFKILRPSVVWVVQNTAVGRVRGVLSRCEGLIDRAGTIVQYTRKQPCYGVHKDTGSQFPSTKYIVANGDLFIHQALCDPFIHAFISATN